MRARENEARATKCFRTLRRPGACFKSHATDLEVHAPRAFGGLKSRPQRGRRAWRRRGHHTCACRSDTCATRNRPAWPPFEFHLPDERSRVGLSRNADSRETCAQGTFPHTGAREHGGTFLRPRLPIPARQPTIWECSSAISGRHLERPSTWVGCYRQASSFGTCIGRSRWVGQQLRLQFSQRSLQRQLASTLSQLTLHRPRRCCSSSIRCT